MSGCLIYSLFRRTVKEKLKSCLKMNKDHLKDYKPLA